MFSRPAPSPPGTAGRGFALSPRLSPAPRRETRFMGRAASYPARRGFALPRVPPHRGAKKKKTGGRSRPYNAIFLRKSLPCGPIGAVGGVWGGAAVQGALPGEAAENKKALRSDFSLRRDGMRRAQRNSLVRLSA